MRKRILSLLCLTVICFVMFHPLWVNAVTPLDIDANASLTLHYQKDGEVFPGLQIAIYRVAKPWPDGTFEVIPPFSSYPVNIYGITAQEQWQNVAATLSAYLTADQVAPDREKETDAEGIVKFDNLETGLYLVFEAVAENAEGTYIFNAFMVYLPTQLPDDSYQYDVEAIPKCISFEPNAQYTITKLWQDQGNQSARPAEIYVDIYRDGVLYETKVLHAGNNWTYTWYVTGEDSGRWTVSERAVPDGYQVTILENGGVFTLINTCQTEPDPPPETGDSLALLPWMFTMCISGIILLILGLTRGGTNEK